MDETTQAPKPKQNTMMMIVGIVVVIAVIGGYMMMRNGSSEQAENTENREGTVAEESSEKMEGETESIEAEGTYTGVVDEQGVRVIDIEAGSFYYKPNVMKVKKGETVRIVMNSVSMMHDFNIDELGVKLPIVKDGDSDVVEFVAGEVGTFEYYCSVGEHRANGQVGMITVE